MTDQGLQPDVSVLMAVHNGAPYLRDAVESVLVQEGMVLELIVVNDGSTDDTASILSSFRDDRIRVLTNSVNLGLTTSLNIGLAAAQAPLVARLDADDLMLPRRLIRQAERLKAEQADICFCACRVRDEANRREWSLSSVKPTLLKWRTLFSNYYGPHPATLFRTDAVRQLGGYDEKFRRSQDYELWDRASAAGLRFAFAPEDGLLYRRHDRAISRNHFNEQFEAGRIVSLRAQARMFPDATANEREGLHFLMFDYARPVSEAAIQEALENLLRRVDFFIKQTEADVRPIWQDVAAQLFRRLPSLTIQQRKQAKRLAVSASLRSRSAITLSKCLRRSLIP